MALTLYTIGHSTRAIDEFVRILQAYGVEMLVDVRRFPKSRANPQFNDDALSATLSQHPIWYLHLEGLSERRKTTAASINTAWQHPSFRGYADYMQTPELRKT